MGLASALLRLLVLVAVCFVTGAPLIFGIAILSPLSHVTVLSVVTIILLVVAAIAWVIFGASCGAILLLTVAVAALAITMGTSFATQDAGFAGIPAKMSKGGVALVTGSTRGIGLEMLRILTEHNYDVFVHGRTVEGMRRAVEQLPEKSRGRAMVLETGADMSSFASVEKFINAVKAHPKSKHLNVLICNSGVGGADYNVSSADGFDLTVHSNYLAGEQIVKLLLPELMANKASIVHVSSGAHNSPGPREAITKFRQHSVYGGDSYGRSKLLQFLGAKVASKKYPELRFAAVHPGACATDMSSEGPKGFFIANTQFPFLSFIIPHLVKLTWFPPRYCAQCTLYAAFSDEIVSGDFTQAYKPVRPGSIALPPYPSVYVTDEFLAEVDAATQQVLP